MQFYLLVWYNPELVGNEYTLLHVLIKPVLEHVDCCFLLDWVWKIIPRWYNSLAEEVCSCLIIWFYWQNIVQCHCLSCPNVPLESAIVWNQMLGSTSSFPVIIPLYCWPSSRLSSGPSQELPCPGSSKVTSSVRHAQDEVWHAQLVSPSSSS